MKVNNHNLTTENIVDFIGSIFERRGGEEYLGEPVTMGQHMLQGATLAEKAGQPDEIIVAALLHDIGHLHYRTQLQRVGCMDVCLWERNLL